MDRDFTDLLLRGLGATYPDLDIEGYQVTARIARLGLHLARRQEEVFGRFGLNRGEVGLLSALRISGAPNQMTPTQIGRSLMLSSAGVTSRVDRLERRGLVIRRPDPDDRRGVLIELTPAGAELVDAAVRANTASEAQLLTSFTADETAALQRLLRKLTASLEAAGPE